MHSLINHIWYWKKSALAMVCPKGRFKANATREIIAQELVLHYHGKFSNSRLAHFASAASLFLEERLFRSSRDFRVNCLGHLRCVISRIPKTQVKLY